MDFVFSRGVGLSHASASALSKRIDFRSTSSVTFAHGDVQLLVAGETGVAIDDEGASFCDGQFSIGGTFFHPLWSRCWDVKSLIDNAIATRLLPANGVFMIGRAVMQPTLRLSLMTDWLGQYPIYYWSNGSRYLVSNNILMMAEFVPSAGRSLMPAADNIVCGGVLKGTHVTDVERLPFGAMISAGETLVIESIHRPSDVAMSYDDTIRHAREEIGRHLNAALQSGGLNSRFIIDLTGGVDSRCVLSFLLASPQKPHLTGRSLTQYPSPDANVAGMLMRRFAIPPAEMPMAGVDHEKMVRHNAALSGGGRDSGGTGGPIGFPQLVHFKGSYGEIGGGTPGLDYVSEAARHGDYTHAKAVDIFLARRTRAGALDLVTPATIAEVRRRLVDVLTGLEEEGYPREHLLAEMYIRKRCRTHFGLMTFMENKSRILPDILANRWLVEARRRLLAIQYTHNRAILDMTVLNCGPELVFAPMANKKWDACVILEAHVELWRNMQIVDASSPPLSDYLGPLYKMNVLADPDRGRPPRVSEAVPPTVMKHSAQGQYVAPFQRMLKYFIDNIAPTDDAWQMFDRDSVLRYLQRTPDEFRPDGLDVNAMGAVNSALFWKARLEAPPALRDTHYFS